jgi:hypothetical protein
VNNMIDDGGYDWRNRDFLELYYHSQQGARFSLALELSTTYLLSKHWYDMLVVRVEIEILIHNFPFTSHFHVHFSPIK